MGVTKVVPLNGKQVTIRELTLEEINTLTARPEDETALEAITALYEAATSATIGELMLCFPSDIEKLVDEVVKANSSFLEQAAKVDAHDVAAGLENLIRSLSLIAFLK